MSSRVKRALVMAVTVGSLALGASGARAYATGVSTLAQRVWVPVVNYGEPDSGGMIRELIRWTPIADVGLSFASPQGLSYALAAALGIVRIEVPARRLDHVALRQRGLH